MHYGFLSILIVLNMLSASCGVDGRNQFHLGGSSGNDEGDQALHESIQSQLVVRNANGEVEAVEGFNYSSEIESNKDLKDNENIRDLYQSEENVFDFEPPDGYDSEISEPKMITGAYLSLQQASACEALAYNKSEPKIKELFSAAAEKGVCGEIRYHYCIKLVPQSGSNTAQDDYIETPPLDISIPCSSYSFSDLAIDISEENLSSDSGEALINLSINAGVTEYYLTNTADCSGGGDWKPVESNTVNWSLNWQDANASVYAKFQDALGVVSDCVSDTVRISSDDEQTSLIDPPNSGAENTAPILTTISNFSTTENQAVTISYDDMMASGDEADADGDSIQFELVSLTSGTLTSDGSTAINIGDLLGSGGQWVWLPGNNVTGDNIAGFSVRAWDGVASSNTPVVVGFDVTQTDNPPTPGASGTISSNSATLTTVSLSWSKATDDNTDQVNLRYCVYRSTSATSSLAEAEAGTLVGSCANDINSVTDSGLTATTDYYYNLVVEDEVGNKALYMSQYAPTVSAFHLVFMEWQSSTDNRLKYATNQSGSVMVNNAYTHDHRIRYLDFDKDDSGNLHILFFDDENNDNSTGDRYYVSGSVGGGFAAEMIPAQHDPRESADISVEGDGTVHIIYQEVWSPPSNENTLFYTTGMAGALSSPEVVTTASPTNDNGWGIDSFVDSA